MPAPLPKLPHLCTRPKLASLALTGSLTLATTVSAVPVVRPDVVRSLPHDSDAFTQGLLLHCGHFFESTGLYGASSLREVEPLTGEVLRSRMLPGDEFGEGLALVQDQLIQLTWREGLAHRYHLGSLAPAGSDRYEGEGWGLCFDGQRLVMSDGSSELFFRDRESFELLGSVSVTRDGLPVRQLNELECVGDLVYANVWMTDVILRIDPGSGQVLTEIDASLLLTPEEYATADVLNGIAYHAPSQHFFLTGKHWPRLFEVSFPFAPGSASSDAGTISGQGTENAGPAVPAEFEPCDVLDVADHPDGTATDASKTPPSRERGAGCLCAAAGTERPWPGVWVGSALLVWGWRHWRRTRTGYSTRSQRTTSLGTSLHR